jgi:hypothetical protein
MNILVTFLRGLEVNVAVQCDGRVIATCSPVEVNSMPCALDYFIFKRKAGMNKN